MKCPVCENVELVLADRVRVDIDYCPRCRGVWLDRGELNKFIERYDRGSRRERDDDDGARDEDDRDRDRIGVGRRRGRRTLFGGFLDVS